MYYFNHMGLEIKHATPSRTRGNRHKIEHRKFNLNREELIYCQSDGALRQAAQRGGGISLSGDVQTPGRFSVQPTLGNLL